jgi:glyoxylase-like metal-dependent hydrolase (beta-lactamase superfamily II)
MMTVVFHARQEHSMLRIYLLAIFYCFSTLALAAKAPAIQQDYAVDEIAEDVYVVHGPTEIPGPQNQGFINNPSFIVTSDGVVVIDPGSSVQIGEMLLSHIEKTTPLPVVAVLNTHVHGDHWLGNQAITNRYPQAKIYAHATMAQMLTEGEGQIWIDFMMRLTEGATQGTEVVQPTDTLSGGDILSIGGLDFHIMHQGPAHTRTDLMVYIKQRAVIYLADNGNQNFIVPVQGSFLGNIRALDDAINSGATIFVPGHGRTSDASVAENYRDFLTTIYETTREGYEEGKADFEIRPELLPRLEPWKSWASFDNQLGSLINFAYLEAEAEAFK